MLENTKTIIAKKNKKLEEPRNKARRIMKKTLGSKINGKDIHHKDKNPLNNLRKNLSVTTKKYNRGKK